MCATDQIQLVLFVELLYYILTKYIADATIVVHPARYVNFGIRPYQVAKETLVRHVCRSLLLVNEL